MWAAQLMGPGAIELVDRPTPRPGPGQVLIRIEGCGLCGSSLPVWQGRPWFEYPLEPGAPGHEGWGRVEATGDGVTSVAPGDRVAALSYHALAEYDVADAAAVVRLPPALDGKDVPGEPLGCAMNVFTRSDVRSGDRVAVIGIGFIGAVVAQLAARAGALVIAISRRRFALSLGRTMGARHTLSLESSDDEVEAAVKELTGGNGCERVIEATGHQRPLDLAGRLAAVRGRLVIAGFHQDGRREVDMQLWNWRGLDVVNAHERDPAEYVRGMAAAIAAIAAGELDPEPLYSHRFSPEQIEPAFRALDERPHGFAKAQVIA